MQNLRECIGLGVAGNFAHHLEQAGEDSDFIHIPASVGAPKGVFPFYVPHAKTYNGIYPFSSNKLSLPKDLQEDDRVQIEPEIALFCDIKYVVTGIKSITPRAFAAYNDCSIRKEDAKKISEKKNWGADTKGLSNTWIPIDSFSLEGTISSYRIVSFFLRNNVLLQYGEDSAANTYSYMYDSLLSWLVCQMNTQEDMGPLENMRTILSIAKPPSHAIIGIGATRYTDVGLTSFLQKGDQSIVVVYDGNKHKMPDIVSYIQNGNNLIPQASVLWQQCC